MSARVCAQSSYGLSGAGEAFHHQPGAALGHVRDDGSASMNLGHDAEIDGKREVDGRAFFQTEVLGFDEDTVGAQVTRAA